MKNLGFQTRQIHSGYCPEKSNNSCVTPIYPTAAYTFRNTQHAENLFNLEEEGHIYTRLSNPTTEILEKRIASLENGTCAVATSSGMSAQFLAIQNLASAGDNIISTSSIYGGSFNQFKVNFPRLGIDVRFAQKSGQDYEIEDFESLIDDNTKAIFVECIGNSDFYIPKFDEISALCQKYKIAFVIDNTFGAGGYIFEARKWGANVITHAATKWIGGHGNSIAGIVIDCGNFDWSSGRYPQFTQPSVAYKGLSFWDKFGNQCFGVRARAEGLRDWGCSLSPFNSFLLLTGVETLSLRVQRECDNAMRIAEYLSCHPQIESVNYIGLTNNPNHTKALKYLKNGFGSVMTICVKGGRNQTAEFVNSLTLISHLTNVGDNKTLISHPASTTHSQMDDNALLKAGIKPNALRISVGIEDYEDIINDIEQALSRIKYDRE